ncbi:MAG: DHHA1 domain-containing protein [Haloarculaceae archaeon]
MPGAGAGRTPLASRYEEAVSILRSNPELAAGVAVALVVLLFVLWAAIRRLRRTKGETFLGVLRKTDDEVAALMHPNPDPDAMACALAVKELAAAVDTEVQMCYPGEIRHQENRAFQTVLNLDFERIERAAELAGDPVVLVDHNTPRGFPGADELEPRAVVDHHPGNGTGSKFTDLRTDNGSCASIFAGYFEEMGWEPTEPAEADQIEVEAKALSPTVATGLLYGIQSDTKNLTKGCSPEEFEAAGYLYRGIDEDRLDRIANPEVDAEVLDVKARAIDARDVRNAFAVSDVGQVSNVDAIPQAADELLLLEGVTAVVLVGENDGTLHLSGRSRDDRVHMGKALRSAVDIVPMADAGGHARMGGGQVSVSHLRGLASNGLSRDDFHDRLFEAMNGEV